MADVPDRSDVILTLAQCIAAVARGDLSEARALVTDAERELGVERQQSLPGLPSPLPQDLETRAHRIFAYWQERCGHETAKWTGDRKAKVQARLREGYTESEVRKAIDGAAAHATVDEETGQKYDDLALICRTGSKLEDFIARGVRSTGEIAVDTSHVGPVEDQISTLRRRMSALRREGRTTEYETAAKELNDLLAQRKGRK